MGSYWLSWGLLFVAYGTYGQMLHDTGAGQGLWVASFVALAMKATVVTLLWRPVRRLVLLGFQSDGGYLIMVLVLASLVVWAVVQFQLFAHVIVLVATTILARVDCLIHKISDRLTCCILLGLCLGGIGVSVLLQFLPW